MSIATDGMEEIIKEFLAESAEGLDLLDRELVELERDPASPERLAEIFRAVDTIKGSSGMLGYPKLESVAHAGESLLGGLRDGKLVLHPALTSGLLAMVDAMRARLKAIEFTGNAPRERTPTERKGRDSTSFRDKLHSRLLGRCRMAPLPRRKAQAS